MSLEYSHVSDIAPTAPTATDRVAYTVAEFCSDVFPMSRAAFYEDVAAGLIHILKRGSRSYVTVAEARVYPARLAAHKTSKAA